MIRSKTLRARRRQITAFALAVCLSQAAWAQPQAPALPPVPPNRMPDVNYVQTPQQVVDAMLEIARVGPDDLIYDLGSGDGRIPITAARRFGTRGIGIDIDPGLVAKAQAGARAAGVEDKVRFVHGDIFRLGTEELGRATVIAMYLLPEINLALRPVLRALPPGTRIVSHAFDLEDWKPDRTITVDGRLVHFWTVPAR